MVFALYSTPRCVRTTQKASLIVCKFGRFPRVRTSSDTDHKDNPARAQLRTFSRCSSQNTVSFRRNGRFVWRTSKLRTPDQSLGGARAGCAHRFADALFTQGLMALMQPIICCVRAQSAREFVTEFSGGATPHRSRVARRARALSSRPKLTPASPI